MFDIGWTEIALVAVVALFVVGPKDLPHVLYKLAGYWRKVRGIAREFQSGLDDMIREAELDELRKQVNSINSDVMDLDQKKITAPEKSKIDAAADYVVGKSTSESSSSENSDLQASGDAQGSSEVDGHSSQVSSSEPGEKSIETDPKNKNSEPEK